MGAFSGKVDRAIDCHAHMFKRESVDKMVALCRDIGFDRMNLLCIANPRSGGGNGEGFCAKARGGGRFYVFGGLNHAAATSEAKVAAPSLAEQMDELLAAGCDGIKLIEGKPTSRRGLPHELDGEYFAELFAAAEARQAPLLWHVADPEEFWDPKLLPDWAARHNWGYDETDVPKERLYKEVAAVLKRHPRLRVLFAHFYFLSADLPRARDFLAAHPSVRIDLALGVELLFNLSGRLEEAREFFIDHADRIVFGTDICDSHSPQEAAVRAGLIRRFLETDETFTVPAEADELLSPGGKDEVHGLDLPVEALEKIYHANFEALAGAKPKPLRLDAAVAVCRRDAEIASALSGVPAEETAAGKCAQALTAGG